MHQAVKARELGVVRAETSQINAACPSVDALDSMRLQLFAKPLCCHQNAIGRCVEATHDWPDPIRRDSRAHCDIVRKTGVKAAVKCHAAFRAPTSACPAERTFSGDMYRIGCKLIHQPIELPWRHRQSNFSITGAGYGVETIRAYHFHDVPLGAEHLHHLLESAHDTVDLRHPSIGDERNLHVVASTKSATAAAPKRVRSAQSRISIRPSKCSTSAVQLSTQSPSL